MRLILDSVTVTMVTGVLAVKMSALVEVTTPAMETVYATLYLVIVHVG